MIKWLKDFLPSKLPMEYVLVSWWVSIQKRGMMLGRHRYASILDLIHSDVAEPMPTKSINGCRYFLTFIDDCSQYCWIYFMKQISEVFETFKVFKAMIENSYNKKIKSIRYNKGGEYIKEIYRFFMNQRGLEWNTQFHTHHSRMVWLRGKIDH